MNSCKKRQLAVDSFLNERAADWYIFGVMVERAAAGVRHDDGLFYQHAGRLVGVLVAVAPLL